MNKIWILCSIVILSACQGEAKGDLKMDKRKQEVQAYCVGRHSISLPVTFVASPVVTGIFKLKGESNKNPAFDIVVESAGMTLPKFGARVEKRRAELKRSKKRSLNLLRMDKALSEVAVLFRVQEIDDAYYSELFMMQGQAIVRIRLESYRNSYLDAEEKILKISRAIKELKKNEVANDSEFCFGPLKIHSDLIQEYASFSFADKDGLKIDLEIDTYGPDEKLPLLSRMSSDDSLLKKFNIRHDVLRARKRAVAGMQADEWLGSGQLDENDDLRTLKFMLETQRQNPGRSTPSISLSLDSAQPLEDGTVSRIQLRNTDALELWDRIVDSIRLNTIIAGSSVSK